MNVLGSSTIAAPRRQWRPLALRLLFSGAALMLLAAFFAWPLGNGEFGLQLGSIVVVYALAVVGLDLVVGRAGMLHVGYGVSFGLGAYSVGMLAQQSQVPTGVGVLLGVAVGALGAAILAPVVSQVSGYLFALVTLAMAGVFEALLRNLPGFGGTSGLSGITRDLVGGGELDSRRLYLLLCAITTLVIWLYRNMRHSRLGRATEALRLTPHVAEASGVGLEGLRFRLWVVSGGLGGLAGGLFAVTVGYVSPDLFGAIASVNFLAMNVLGGLGIAWSGVPGAILVRGLPQAVQELGTYQLVLVGAAMGLVAIWFRRGIAGTIEEAWRRLPELHARPAPPVGSTGKGDISWLVGVEAYCALTKPDEAILRAENVRVRFGGLVAVNGVSLALYPGKVTALVGPNGSGKTTLVETIAGRVKLEQGTISFCGRDVTRLAPTARVRVGLTRTFQLVSLCESLTVLENTMLGGHLRGKAGLLAACLPVLARNEERELAAEALGLLRSLGIADLALCRPAVLSAGQRRLVEIARCLMTGAAVILLDEPASGLNASEREHLADVVRTLARSGRAILMIEHDMRFVMGLADWIAVLLDGALLGEGEPEAMRNDQRVIEAYWGAPLTA